METLKTKNLLQTVTFKNVSPGELYEMIMDKRKHSRFTGGDVSMSRKVGGKFVVFDGYCHGHNIELEEGKKIVQAWHFAEEGWPDDHFSICTFTFTKKGKDTLLKFVQSSIPEHKVEDLKKGWKNYYWEPMKMALL